jgi:hypothetical protein
VCACSWMGGWLREEFELRPMHLKAIDLLMMKGMRAHGGVGREEPSAQRAQARIGCEIPAAAISIQLTFLPELSLGLLLL